MNIFEHNEHQYEKQKTPLEIYLKRILQRFLTVKEKENALETEEIINEALTRFKRDVAQQRSSIFNINGRTGDITLSAQMFGIEPKIKEKRTAFNKDFGVSANTLLTGNDNRLSDARDPLPHYHSLEEFGINYTPNVSLPVQLHVHSNMDVLDKIRYTGNNNAIDLVGISIAANDIKNRVDLLESQVNEFIIKDCDDEIRKRLVQRTNQKEELDKYIHSLSLKKSNIYDASMQATTKLYDSLTDFLKKKDLKKMMLPKIYYTKDHHQYDLKNINILQSSFALAEDSITVTTKLKLDREDNINISENDYVRLRLSYKDTFAGRISNPNGLVYADFKSNEYIYLIPKSQNGVLNILSVRTFVLPFKATQIENTLVSNDLCSVSTITSSKFIQCKDYLNLNQSEKDAILEYLRTQNIPVFEELEFRPVLIDGVEDSENVFINSSGQILFNTPKSPRLGSRLFLDVDTGEIKAAYVTSLAKVHVLAEPKLFKTSRYFPEGTIDLFILHEHNT